MSFMVVSGAVAPSRANRDFLRTYVGLMAESPTFGTFVQGPSVRTAFVNTILWTSSTATFIILDNAEQPLKAGRGSKQAMAPVLQAAGLRDATPPGDRLPWYFHYADELSVFLLDNDIPTEVDDVLDFLVTNFQNILSGPPLTWQEGREILRYFQAQFRSEDYVEIGLCPGALAAQSTHVSTSQKDLWITSAMQTCKQWESPSWFRPHEVVVLHLYSGRRRHGDLQHYLEKFWPAKGKGILTVVSVDLVCDEQWGDVTKQATREFWLQAIASRWVAAIISGPPCETWSIARSRQTPGAFRNALDLVLFVIEDHFGAF